MSRELQVMGSRGVQVKRLKGIALDILLSKAAASQVLERSQGRDVREWARRALEFLDGLEAQVVRLYSSTLARRMIARRLRRGMGFAALSG